jgi:uncharacterized protein (TIGR02391 family)
MADAFHIFERAARMAASLSNARPETVVESDVGIHPFEIRNIHPKLPARVKKLFDDGYYAESTFAAFKFLDKTVANLSSVRDTGWKLMMDAFDEAKPKIKLNALKEVSEIDEQKGYRFIFAGAAQAVRNPRGHEVEILDDLDQCLDHLTFASILLRRLETAGYMI